MEVIIVIAGILLALIIKGIYDRKNIDKKTLAKIRKQYGAIPAKEYSEIKLESLAFYHKHLAKTTDIDDITWNDLDLKSIYMLINSTFSCMGEEYMYHILRSPVFDEDILKERERLIEHYRTNKTAREQMSLLLSRIGTMKKISMYEYMNRLKEVKPDSNSKHVLQALLLISTIVYILVNPPVGVIMFILAFFYNVMTYLKRKAEIENYFSVVAAIMRLIDFSKEISKSVDDPAIEDYKLKLGQCAKNFKSLRNGSFVITPIGGSADLLQSLLDYVRMAFHFDLIKFNSMIKVFAENTESFDDMFSVAGLLDSALAIASYRESEDIWCVPELLPASSDKKHYINAVDLGHPLIDDPVRNSIETGKSILLTGSNASGKSTFIKSLAINAILTQTIHTATASAYTGSYFRIMSSMALQDNIQGGESYYIVEIKSLKRIMDQVNDDIPVLCFIDEVLKGTNTLERIAASSRILKSLADTNTLTFAATHDIELTFILEKCFDNYHFEEQVEDNKVEFDYRLKEGRAVTRNAIKLLGMLGYPPAIIDSAQAMAEDYLKTGEWSVY